MYPNPAQNSFNVISPQLPIKEVVLHDISGRKVSAQPYNSKKSVTVAISNLETAVYFVTISTEHGTITKRLIKK